MILRKHLLTGEPVLFAPERAARPRAFEGAAGDERCPFCPGHESDTPPTISRVGDPWRVRVFPNKYPPIDGAEVIVESPLHEDRFDRIEHAEDVVGTYVDRLRAHDDAAHVSIFKNEGARAGSSIDHLHSQVIPLPFVPPRIERELAGFASSCALCVPPRSELVIAESENFVWLAPYTSTMAYQQWIVPKRHVATMTAFTDAEIADVASLLRRAAAAMTSLADAFNWMLMNFPCSSSGHAYVDLVPRMTAIAGFELGTGTFVEIIDPAVAALRLRR